LKAHLLTTELPIVGGQSQTCDCGQQIAKARIVMMWDEQAMGEGISYGRNVCPKCILADSGPREKRIVYGICEQQVEE
jgi:hypothetical protein